MRIKVDHRGVTSLAVDQVEIAKRARPDCVGVVREGIRTGGMLARDFARSRNPIHARRYAASITWEMYATVGLAEVAFIQGVYGPAPGGQGSLAGVLENGEGRNAAQDNLTKSADVIGPAFAGEIRGKVNDWFDMRNRI